MFRIFKKLSLEERVAYELKCARDEDEDDTDVRIGEIKRVAMLIGLNSIGTSEQELGELLNKHYKRTAIRALSNLRRGVGVIDVSLIRLMVYNGSFELADIGTSEQELKEISLLYYKNMAKEALLRLRGGCENKKDTIRMVTFMTSVGGFELADIGTSEEELRSFLDVNNSKD